MAAPKKGKRGTKPVARAAERKEERAAAPRLRRKNLILDQDRIDRARVALGAATETETITRALDQVIDVADMRAEIDAVLTELAGQRFNIINYFDDPEALDYSGFADVFPDLAGGLSTPEARAAAGLPPEALAPEVLGRNGTHKSTRGSVGTPARGRVRNLKHKPVRSGR